MWCNLDPGVISCLVVFKTRTSVPIPTPILIPLSLLATIYKVNALLPKSAWRLASPDGDSKMRYEKPVKVDWWKVERYVVHSCLDISDSQI